MPTRQESPQRDLRHEIQPKKEGDVIGEPQINLADWSKSGSTAVEHAPLQSRRQPPTLRTWINGTIISEYTSDRDFCR